MADHVVKEGDQVRLDFTLKLEDGTVMGSTVGDEPVAFVVGGGEVIPGLDRAVLGMSVGSSRTAHLSVEDAYGPRLDELVQEIDRSLLPPGYEPIVGQTLEMESEDDAGAMEVMVVDVSDSSIKVDANHPLAGKNLVVDLRVVEIL